MTRRLCGPALMGVLLWLGGCATTPAPGASPEERTAGSEQGAQPADRTTRESPSATDAATLALLEQSERAVQNGSLAQALTYAERAVRIDPRNAAVWTRLAALELTNNNPHVAAQYADKALSLSVDRPDLQRAAWLVIADAREATGDLEAARAIRARWQTGRG